MRQIAAAIAGVGLALGALGLDGLPLVAWTCALSLDVLAIVASLALVATGRRELMIPGIGLAGAAVASGIFAPAMEPAAVARGLVAMTACGAFLMAFVLWSEVERRVA
jgi:hypothetical protein